jgi:hypothetical protein
MTSATVPGLRRLCYILRMPNSPSDPPDSSAKAKEPLLPPTKPGEVFGMLRYKGKPKTLKEMDDAIAAEVRRRHERGEY